MDSEGAVVVVAWEVVKEVAVRVVAMAVAGKAET